MPAPHDDERASREAFEQDSEAEESAEAEQADERMPDESGGYGTPDRGRDD